jgi:hypothetical protein
MASRRSEEPNLAPVLVGAGAAVVLAAIFLILEKYIPETMKLPAGWIVLAVVPVIVGLFIGRWVTYVKTPLGELGRAELLVPADATIAPSLESYSAYVKQNPGRMSHDSAMEEAHETYIRQRLNLALVHVFVSSKSRGQKYEVFIFLSRHIDGEGKKNQVGNLDHIVQSAEFFFGSSWGDGVFHAMIDGGPIGVKVLARGSFWATCRLTFRPDAVEENDPNPVYIHRYIDFESDDLLK